jgi:hypothetical protein
VWLEVATIPEGYHDVDDVLRFGGDSVYDHMLANARPAVSWMIGNLNRKHDLRTLQGRVAACDEVLDSLLRAHPIERAEYVRELASALDTDEADVRRALNEVLASRGEFRHPDPPAHHGNAVGPREAILRAQREAEVDHKPVDLGDAVVEL